MPYFSGLFLKARAASKIEAVSIQSTLIQRVFHIRLLKKVLQRASDLRKVDGWSPVFTQNVQTHMTFSVNVRMENLSALTHTA